LFKFILCQITVLVDGDKPKEDIPHYLRLTSQSSVSVSVDNQQQQHHHHVIHMSEMVSLRWQPLSGVVGYSEVLGALLVCLGFVNASRYKHSHVAAIASCSLLIQLFVVVLLLFPSNFIQHCRTGTRARWLRAARRGTFNIRAQRLDFYAVDWQIRFWQDSHHAVLAFSLKFYGDSL
jgi:hypothetical protein